MEKNKKWIKIFAAFLAFMWLCTIISKSIYVSGLTRVKTDMLSKKYIEHVVEADGIVLAGKTAAVNVLSGLRVESVDVQKGDMVKKGDTLFCVDLGDLEEQISKKEDELARISLQLLTAQFNETLSAQKKEIGILWAKEDYENADKETALAVERAQNALSKAENELQKHLDTSAPQTSGGARKKAWEKYNDWKNRCYELEDKIAAAEKEIQKLKNEVTDAKQETETEDKNALLAQKEEDLEELKTKLAGLERNPVSKPDYSAEESAYDAWQQTKSGLEDSVQAAKRALDDANLARESTLRQKRRDVASAQVLSNADAAVELYNMEIAALQAEIADLNDVKSIKGIIAAQSGGYIEEILVSTGQRTADTAAMLISDMESECMFNFSITDEQAKYVRLGDSLTLKLNSGDAADVSVTADYVTKNSAGGYDITCRLGELKAPVGSYGAVKRTVQGQLHPAAVPIEAVYGENGAYYLYTLNEKAGILGKEYYVEKVKVGVTDKNDRYAAIESASIAYDTQIVIFSSKELKQGESVRVDE